MLIVDEPPTRIVTEKHLKIGRSHRHITTHIQTIDSDSNYVLVYASDPTEIAKIAKSDDEVDKVFRILAFNIISPHHDVYVHKDAFDDLINDRLKTKSITFYYVLKPSKFLTPNGGAQTFKFVLFASAHFEETLCYKIWSKNFNVRWQDEVSLAERLRYKEHDNASRLKIVHYELDRWTKTNGKKEFDGKPLLDSLRDDIYAFIDGKKCLIHVNKDAQETTFADLPSNFKLLERVPHGINAYQDYDNIVFISAINNIPTAYGFYDILGIDSESLRRSNYYELIYQSLLRTSQRNPNATGQVTLVVVDCGAAQYIHELFPGSAMELRTLAATSSVSVGKNGRPRLYGSDSERVAAHRKKQEKIRIDRLHDFRERLDKKSHVIENVCNETSYMKYSNVTGLDSPTEGRVYTPKSTITIYAKTDCTKASDTLVFEYWNGLVAFMEKRWIEKIARKDDRHLFIPAQVSGRRRKIDAKEASFVVLDIDRGTVSPAEFASYFPSLTMVIINTFSTTAIETRFRALLPVSRAMSADEYHHIVTVFIELCELKWPMKETAGKTMIDHSSRSLVQTYYLPCQAMEAAASFFHVFDDEERSPIDVDFFLKNAPVKLARAKPVANKLPVSPAPIRGKWKPSSAAAAVAAWRADCKVPQAGHDNFFKLAGALHRAGLAEANFRQTLDDEAAYAIHPHERREEIEGLILKFYG
jgi:hypothetical protein